VFGSSCVEVFKDFSSAFRKREREDAMLGLLPARVPRKEIEEGEAAGARIERAAEDDEDDKGGGARIERAAEKDKEQEEGAGAAAAIQAMEDNLLGAKAKKKVDTILKRPVSKRVGLATTEEKPDKKRSAAVAERCSVEVPKLPAKAFASVEKGIASLFKAVTMKDVFKRLRERREKFETRQAFTTAAYGYAKRRAFAAGAPRPIANLYASHHSRKASKLFDATS